MIKSVTVTNPRGDSLKMELTRPDLSGFVISSITGLGPGSATINTTETSTTDGGFFNSSHISSRNIVISLIYWSQDSIESVRQRSYKYFPLKGKIKLLIETDNRAAEIEGYVESNEPNIFSEEEGSDISIICPDPFFYSAYENHKTTFSSIEPTFEFPFSNESLSEPLIEMSQIRDTNDRVISYEGDAEIGITMRIRAHGPASNITIYKIDTRETMIINTDTIESIMGSPIADGDEIVISTVKGNKSATFVRDAKSTNILNSIDRSSSWFQLIQGNNIFAYAAETGSENLEFEIQNRVLYGGV